MPTIECKRITKARKAHRCDMCGRWCIKRGDSYCRLFGYAEKGDPPYVVKCCDECDSRMSKQ